VPVRDESHSPEYVFRLEGEYWTVGDDVALVRLKNTKGLRYIVQLLRAPGREFHVTDLIAAEHPQTAAVILAHLEADQASQALRLLPDEARLDIAYRLATLNEIHPDVLKELSEVLEAAVKPDVKAKGPQLGGVKFLAEIMNGLDRATEQTVTAGLAEKNPELADSVRQLMFVFEDLAILDDRGFQDLLKEVAKEDLMLALRATSEPVKAAVFRNMSSRAAEMLKDDLEAAPPVKRARTCRQSSRTRR